MKVYGISTDDVAAQKAFHESQKLTYPLIADHEQKAAKAYDVLYEGRPFAKRISFVIDPTGDVRHVFDKVDVKSHGAEVLAVLKKLGAAPGGDTGNTGALDEESFKALHELKKGEAPKLHGKDLDLGESKAYLSLPKGKGPFPGVLVIHEWWGLNDHVKHWTDRLAAEGYAALAVDLYGGVVATTPDEAMKAMRAVDDKVAATVIQTGLSYLRNDAAIKAPRLATIGWCFGGGWSLKAALTASSGLEPDAVVIYYGRLSTEAATLRTIKGSVLGVFANRDRSIPPATVEAFEKGLQEAGIKHAIHRYDADHAFANPSSARYDATAAADAWKKVRAFLDRQLRQKD